MPIIRPISYLRNKFADISTLCHAESEPVFITKNGKGDLIVMSQALFEKYEALLDLYQKLGVAQQQHQENMQRIPHDAMMEQLRDRLNDR